jgi:hypothetical protein
MNARTKSLRRPENSAMLLKYRSRPFESATLPFGISESHDKTTCIYSFL